MNTLNLKDKWIDDFFKDDYLDFTKYPDKEIAEYYGRRYRLHIMDFTVYKSPSLANELKTITKMGFTGFHCFSYKSAMVRKMFQMVIFLKDSTVDSIFEHDKEQLKDGFLEYFNASDRKPVHQMVENMFFFLNEYHDKREGLDRDIWYIDKLSLDENRLNKSQTISTLNFFEIENEANRELIKQYSRYQLGGTELSLATIINHISILKQLSNYLKKDFTDYDEKDAFVFQEYLNEKNCSVDNNNRQIQTGINFYNYLIANELYESKNPFLVLGRKNERKPVQSSVSDFVIRQIFYNLDLAPFDIMVMYVINYCTGIRISDICQLEADSTFTAKGHYFIKHKVQKMKKFQANIIPEAAYKLIKQQEAIVKKNNPVMK